LFNNPEVDELFITQTSADVSATMANGPADVTLFWATTDYGTNLADWQNNGSSNNLGSQVDGVVSGSPSGLMSDTVYTARFYGLNTAADPDEEGWSAPITFGTLFSPDKRVTDLSATPVAYNQVELTWTDNFNTEEEYIIEASDDGGQFFFQVASLPANSTSYLHTGVDEQTTYEYRILAFSFLAGDSEWSDPASATTPAMPPFTATVHSDFDFDDNLIPAVFDTIPYGSGPATGGGVLTFDGTTVIQADTATIYGGTAPADRFVYELIVTPSELDAFDIAGGIVAAGGGNVGSFLFHSVSAYSLIEAGEGPASGTTAPQIGTPVALAFVMENGTARLFVNGAEETSRDFDSTENTPIDTADLAAVVLGGNLFDGANGAWNGTIDRARFSTFNAVPFDPSFLLTVSAPSDSFSSWIDGFAVTDTSLTGDDDGDGLANGLENFFGTDPSVANSGIRLGTVSATDFTFSHPQSDNPADDLAASYEWSVNLVDWYAADGIDGPVDGPRVTIPSVAPVDGVANLTATPDQALDQVFVRINVSFTP
jgi:hypothetical protein